MVELLSVLVEGVTGLAALAVFAANPRRASNVAFALFMALICANFAAGDVASLRPLGSPWNEAWNRVAFAALILDPAALLLFVGVFPRRNRLARADFLGGVLLLAAALLVLDATGAIGARYDFTWPRVFLFAYMGLAYLASLTVLLVVASRETSPVWRLQANALAAGLGAALLPRFGIVPVELEAFGGATPEAWIVGSLLAGAAAAVAYSAARLAGADRQGIRRPFLLAVGLAAPFLVGWLLAAAAYASGNAPSQLSTLLGRHQYSLRWIVFALVVGVAILRFQVVRFDRRVALPLSVLVPAAAVGFAAVLGHAVGAGFAGPVLGFSPGQLGVLVALSVGIPAALRWQPRLARLLRLPEGEGRLDLYRRVLVETMQDPTPERERLLAQMRKVCRVSAEADAVLRREIEGGRASLLPGVLLSGRYRVLEAAGEGAGGTVWKAEDERIGRPVALKPVAKAAAGAELAVLARLRHPGLLRLYDVVESAAGPVLVTEWAESGTLRAAAARYRSRPGEVAALGAGLLQALEAIHAAGLVHGDLKPDNILLTDSGAKIADFGAARGSGDATRSLRAGPLRGTPRYLPPEALTEGAGGPPNDLWATAVVLLELVAGPQAVRQPRRALRSLSRDARGLADVLGRALQEDPAARFPDAASFRRALEGA